MYSRHLFTYGGLFVTTATSHVAWGEHTESTQQPCTQSFIFSLTYDVIINCLLYYGVLEQAVYEIRYYEPAFTPRVAFGSFLFARLLNQWNCWKKQFICGPTIGFSAFDVKTPFSLFYLGACLSWTEFSSFVRQKLLPYKKLFWLVFYTSQLRHVRTECIFYGGCVASAY